MEFRSYLHIFRRWIWFVFIVVVGSTLTVCLVSYFYIEKVFESTATILVSTRASTSEDGNAPFIDVLQNTRLIKVYSTLAQSDKILEQVIKELNLKIGINDLRPGIKVQTIEDTGIIKIIVNGSTPQLTRDIASSLVKNLQVEANRIKLVGSINIIDAAKLPITPIKPNPMLNIFLAAIASITVGISVAYFFEYMDCSIKDVQTIKKLTPTPILGVIPNIRKYKINIRKVKREKQCIFYKEEAYRILRTKLNSLNALCPAKVIMVTSPGFSEGKSTIAANLAASMQEVGKRTLLIDSNFHKPYLQKVLNMSDNKGLADFLSETEDTPFEPITIADINLDVVISGSKPDNPNALLQSVKMSTYIEKARQSYDTVIIDSPHITGTSDAIILSGLVDGIILVVCHRKTTCVHIESAIEDLNSVNANILGIVANKTPMRKNS